MTMDNCLPDGRRAWSSISEHGDFTASLPRTNEPIGGGPGRRRRRRRSRRWREAVGRQIASSTNHCSRITADSHLAPSQSMRPDVRPPLRARNTIATPTANDPFRSEHSDKQQREFSRRRRRVQGPQISLLQTLMPGERRFLLTAAATAVRSSPLITCTNGQQPAQTDT